MNVLFYTRMKVGIYCRVSTNFDSQKSSIEHQIDGLRKLVDENPCWEYSDTFVDISSGLNINKQLQLQLLKKRCLSGEINLIVFKDLTRFSRNTIDTLIYMRELINHGVTFYCVLGSFFHSQKFNNELLITLMSAMAQEEVRNMSRTITWGYERRFEQGIQPYRTKCFGYEYDDFGKLVINENEAKVIRYMFSEFLKGGTIYSIAKQVSKLGVNTVKGNKNWNPNTINYILKNTLYTGDMLMPKKMRLDILEDKRVPIDSRKNQYLVEENHEGIVDKTLFDKVQVEMGKRQLSDNGSQIKRKYSSKNPLSNILVCKVCGSSFRRVLRKRKGIRIPCWVCATHAETGREKCENNEVYTEEKIFEMLGINCSENILNCMNVPYNI